MYAEDRSLYNLNLEFVYSKEKDPGDLAKHYGRQLNIIASGILLCKYWRRLRTLRYGAALAQRGMVLFLRTRFYLVLDELSEKAYSHGHVEWEITDGIVYRYVTNN